MHSINLFDINFLDDLPQEIIRDLKKNYNTKCTPRLMNLFVYKKELTIDELLIGYYRKYGEIKGRLWILNTLSNNMKRGKIKKVEPDKYTLGEQEP